MTPTVILMLAMLAPQGEKSLTVRVNVTEGTPVAAPARPGGRGPLAPALMGIAIGTTNVPWPRGRQRTACAPNLDPEESAWRELLEEADGRLCTVTYVPA